MITIYIDNKFKSSLSRKEFSLGVIFIPVYVIFLPILTSWLCSVINSRFGTSLDNSWACFICAALAFFIILVMMNKYLKNDFISFRKTIVSSILAILVGYAVYYLLGLMFSFVLVDFLPSTLANPYEAAYYTMLEKNPRPVMAAAIFLIPMVEEVLFRAVIFGKLLEKNRIAAYLVSALAFGLSRIWVYVFAFSNFSYLIFALVYVPFGIGLSWAYEKGENVFAPYILNVIVCATSLL